MQPNVKKSPNYAKLGKVSAPNKEALGKKVVQHIGLGLDNPEHIGKWVVKSKMGFVGEIKVGRVEHWQKAWGYDKDGNYVPSIPAMRTYSNGNDFGTIIFPSDALFIEPHQLDTIREYLAKKHIEGRNIIMTTEAAPPKSFFNTLNREVKKLLTNLTPTNN